MASGTWVYLGHFHFDAKAIIRKRGSVELINISDQTGRKLSADAVRFGGGEGVIERNGRTVRAAPGFWREPVIICSSQEHPIRWSGN